MATPFTSCDKPKNARRVASALPLLAPISRNKRGPPGPSETVTVRLVLLAGQLAPVHTLPLASANFPAGMLGMVMTNSELFSSRTSTRHPEAHDAYDGSPTARLRL